MGALRFVAAAMALAFAVSAQSQSVDQWHPLIAEASARFGVPAPWIERVMTAESGGRTTLGGRPITSRAGAMGLMQLMPGTWADMRARLRLGGDPHDPRDNILAGTFYLRLMYDLFGYPGLFAAYNAGPGRYANHLATGRPLPGESRAYLVTVAGRDTGPVSATASAPADRPANAIFFALRPPRARAETAVVPSPGGLFVRLRGEGAGPE